MFSVYRIRENGNGENKNRYRFFFLEIYHLPKKTMEKLEQGLKKEMVQEKNVLFCISP
jgi:hypothetical protein